MQGRSHLGKGTTLGYLPQDGIEVHGKTLFEEAASAFPEIVSLQADP